MDPAARTELVAYKTQRVGFCLVSHGSLALGSLGSLDTPSWTLGANDCI